MKQFFYLLLFIAGLLHTASGQYRISQLDSLYANPATRDSLMTAPIIGADSFSFKHATIVLPGILVADFVAYAPDLGRADMRNLLNQIKAQNTGQVFDTGKVFTLSPTFQLTQDSYVYKGSQQERLTAENNARTQDLLIPQLRKYPQLYLAILQIAYRNKKEAYGKTCQGAKIIMDTILY